MTLLPFPLVSIGPDQSNYFKGLRVVWLQFSFLFKSKHNIL